MASVLIACPHCTFRREVPREKLPDRKGRLTCPQCRQSIPFDPDAVSTPPPEPAAPPPAAPSPAPPSAPSPAPSPSAGSAPDADRILIVCPRCGDRRTGLRSKAPARATLTCPACHASFEFVRDTPPASGTAAETGPAPEAPPPPPVEPSPAAPAMPAGLPPLDEIEGGWEPPRLPSDETEAPPPEPPASLPSLDELAGGWGELSLPGSPSGSSTGGEPHPSFDDLMKAVEHRAESVAPTAPPSDPSFPASAPSVPAAAPAGEPPEPAGESLLGDLEGWGDAAPPAPKPAPAPQPHGAPQPPPVPQPPSAQQPPAVPQPPPAPPASPASTVAPQGAPSPPRTAAASPSSPIPPPPPPPPPRTPRPSAGGSGRLRGIGELFREAADAYRRRFLVLVVLELLAVLALALPFAGYNMLVGFLPQEFIEAARLQVVLTGVVAAFVALLLFLRAFSSLLAATVDDSLGIGAALDRGRGLGLPLLWTSLLAGFIVVGGTFLLLVPGILLSISFFGAVYLVAGREARGMDALLMSRLLVKGRRFPVFVRLFLVGLLSALLGAIPYAGPVAGFLFAPFTMLFHALLLSELKRSSPPPPASYPAGEKAKWLAVGVAGHVVMAAVVVALGGAALLVALSGAMKKAGTTLPGPGSPPGGTSFPSFPTGAPFPGQVSPGSSAEPGFVPPASGQGAAAAPFDEGSLSFFIYAVNAPGVIRVNGGEVATLKAEPDMQYNLNLSGKNFRAGANAVQVEVEPVRGEGRTLSPEVHLRVSRNGTGADGSTVLGEWRFSDPDGWPKEILVEVPSP